MRSGSPGGWASTVSRSFTPRQVDLLHRAYAPTPKELDYANKVMAAADDAHRNGLGVVALDGKMIDPPVIKEAQLVVSLVYAS